VWEKIHEKMQEIGRQNKGLKEQIGAWAKKTGLEHNRNLLNGGTGASLQYKVANAVVFKKVKAALGLAKCKYFFSAAAPMSKDVLDYFMSLDMRILEIYGMSECSGPHMSNTMDVQKIGTIGKELPGFMSKIRFEKGSQSNKGELCLKGRHVMMGYLFNEEKTAEVFDDEGWLKSGDIAAEDCDGFVSITGRIKELIITAGGENIPPVLIEDAIKSELPCISNAVVIGDRRKFLSCILTLKVDVDSETMMPQKTLAPNALAWCRSLGVTDVQTVNQAMANPVIGAAIQDGINRANAQAASSAQKIQKWSVLSDDFSMPGGELGPTLKMKRHVVMEKNLKTIERFYA
jgi:long-chain-fatty-acid--CoA ligase ACSBG